MDVFGEPWTTRHTNYFSDPDAGPEALLNDATEWLQYARSNLRMLTELVNERGVPDVRRLTVMLDGIGAFMEMGTRCASPPLSAVQWRLAEGVTKTILYGRTGSMKTTARASVARLSTWLRTARECGSGIRLFYHVSTKSGPGTANENDKVKGSIPFESGPGERGIQCLVKRAGKYRGRHKETRAPGNNVDLLCMRESGVVQCGRRWSLPQRRARRAGQAVERGL
jgi:hypothetical protein